MPPNLDATPDLPSRAASTWPWVLVCAAAALVIDLGRYHTHHHGDSIVPILISLQEWTLFYWEQNRLGSLFPALALPFRHPLDNLLVQHFFSIFLSLVPLFLVPRYVLKDRCWPLVGVIGTSFYLVLAPEFHRFNSFGQQMPWWSALSLGLGGMILIEKPRRAVKVTLGAGLLLLGHWLNNGLIVPLGLLLLFRTLFDGRSLGPTRRLRELAGKLDRVQVFLLIGAFGFAMLLTVLSPYNATNLQPLSPLEWIPSWGKMLGRLWEDLAREAPLPWPVALFLLAGVGIAYSRWRNVPGREGVFAASATLATAGVATALIIGSLSWVKWNDWDSRYWLIPQILLQASLVVLGTSAFLADRTGRWNRWTLRLGGPLLIGICLVRYGPPSVGGVREDLDRTLGKLTDDLIESNCTHVVGNYWDVWTAVYHVNLTLRDRGESRPIWGLTHRTEPTRYRWADRPPESFRFGAAREPRDPENDDAIIRGWLDAYLRPGRAGELVPVEVRRTIRVLHWEPARRDD